MAWADDFWAELLRRLEGLDPFADVAVAGVVVSAVHAGVSGEQDAFVREPRETVAVGVRDAEVEQFDAHLAVIEHHVLGEEQCWRLEFGFRDIFPIFRGIVPTIGCCFGKEATLVLTHFCDGAEVSNGSGSGFVPELVCVGVVAVVMRVERETDGLGRESLDFGDDLLRAGREVCVDDHDVIVEDDPAIVAMAFLSDFALVEEDVWRDGLNLIDLRERVVGEECGCGEGEGGERDE